jgi:hypothetical protein
MSSNVGWIGVDLDGTIAHYDNWRGIEHIGYPIPLMVDRVKAWVAAGQEVRIFTARVANDDPAAVRGYIWAWLLEQGLPALDITNVKDFGMIELWDDRARQVVPNTGVAYVSPE